MLHVKYQVQLSVFAILKKLFIFFLTWTGRPSLSCHPDHLYIFLFPCIQKFSHKIGFQMIQKVLRETSFNFETEYPWPRSKNDLEFDTHVASFPDLVEYIYQL